MCRMTFCGQNIVGQRIVAYMDISVDWIMHGRFRIDRKGSDRGPNTLTRRTWVSRPFWWLERTATCEVLSLRGLTDGGVRCNVPSLLHEVMHPACLGRSSRLVTLMDHQPQVMSPGSLPGERRPGWALISLMARFPLPRRSRREGPLPAVHECSHMAPPAPGHGPPEKNE
jgi:hypothetical protein